MAHFKSGEAKEEVERGGREAKKKKKKELVWKRELGDERGKQKVDPENRDMQCVCVHVLKRARESQRWRIESDVMDHQRISEGYWRDSLIKPPRCLSVCPRGEGEHITLPAPVFRSLSPSLCPLCLCLAVKFPQREVAARRVCYMKQAQNMKDAVWSLKG